MAKKRFWKGFAAGAASGVGVSLASLLAANLIGRARHSNIVRLEKAIQIGKPVNEVFDAWIDFERLPQYSDTIQEVTREGDRSHWKVQVDGKSFEWDSEIEQFIPNQAVGWKSVSGPKHTGRITFSSLGNDTLMQVTMNYAPPLAVMRPFVQPMTGPLRNFLEQVLRDFKATLEGKGQEGRLGQPRRSGSQVGPGTEMTGEAARATGTFGMGSEVPGQTQHTRFGGPTNPVEYTRPPEAKS